MDAQAPAEPIEIGARPRLAGVAEPVAEEAGVDGARAILRWLIVGHAAGVGMFAAGWLADPDGDIAGVTLETEAAGRFDLSAAPRLGGHEAQDLFRVPPGVHVQDGFVVCIRGVPAAARLGATLRLRSGAVYRHRVPATGDLRDLGDLLARAPLDFGLAVATHILTGYSKSGHAKPADGSAAVWHHGPLPAFIDQLIQRVFERIGTSQDAVSETAKASVECHVDLVIRAGRHGMLLKGWLLTAASDSVQSIALVSLSGRRAPIPWPPPRLARPDVIEDKAAAGFSRDRNCGYVVWVPVQGLDPADRRWYIDLATARGARRRVPLVCPPEPTPQAAVRAIVALAEPAALDFNDLFSRAIAPALDWFWQEWQRSRPPPTVRHFGQPPAEALVSIIVPLYGRIDFVRHQIASFSNDPDFRTGRNLVELIYVLDDPAQEPELMQLCRLLHDIYGVAFRVVLLGGNYGYSAANNAGAAVATGRYLLLLNSDVMPKRPGWLSQLAALHGTLDRCGVLGCRLLFEDGSIQHAGMNFRPSLFFADAWTNEHGFKGLSTLFDPHADTAEVTAVTGACLLIERTVFATAGGLSQDYVIGDFEDSDLCLKVRDRGLKIYYTPHVELYHLERQSMRRIGQGHETWRQGLTFFNMWKHSRRWQSAIRAILGEPDGCLPELAATEAPPADTDVALPANPLHEFATLGAGREIALLSVLTVAARTSFVPFPAASAGLTPCVAPPMDMDLPRFSLFEFEHVNLHGFRLCEHAGKLFNDHSLVDPTTESNRHFWQKFRAGQNEDVVLGEDGLPVPTGRLEEIDGSGVLVLSSDEPVNFGSWIYRYLAKFILARRHHPYRRVFAYDDHRWMLPVLQLADPAVEIIPQTTTQSYCIRNATIASLPAPHVYFRPELGDEFAAIVARIGIASGLPERIYVSRRKHALSNRGMRVLENETELVEKLQALGFAEFFPEDHPLPMQLAIFAGARIIVSPGGANLFNAAFAQRADFILDLESSDNWLHAHMNLLASTTRPFSVVQGLRTGRGDPIHANWTIDADAVIAGLRTLGVV